MDGKPREKAAELNVTIQAHPWIQARIWEVLTDDQPYESPFGMLLDQATVTLHIYDELDPAAGKKILLRDKGKKVEPESASLPLPN